ncbi:MAG TPA: oligosaccharide flippase family protein [Ignavibacteria bacterium]|nr:oligosaccharide flippase family protein [Ignavibacteria bacterium]
MKLIINFASKLGVDSISRLIGFVTLPLITRALGPEGYGQFSYLFVILSYFGFFIDFGYLSYGTNKLCDNSGNKKVVGNIISLQLLTAFISFLILCIVAFFFLETEKYILLIIFSATFISQIFSIKYYYLASNKLYYNSVSELAGQVVYTLLIFFVFTKYPTVFTLIILTVLQTFITAMFLFIPYLRKNKIEIDLNLKRNLKTLKDAYKLGIASKAEALTVSFIILCLGFFLNQESVGLYNASYKIYVVLLTVVQGLSYTFMPVLLMNIKNNDKIKLNKISFVFYIYLLTGIVLSTLTYIFADKIILILFGETFFESISILKSFSVTIFIWPILMFLGLIILAYNKYNYLLITSVFSAVFSVLFSLIFIKSFGLTGAGYVLPFVAAGSIIISAYFLKKISGEKGFRFSELFSLKSALTEFKLLIFK